MLHTQPDGYLAIPATGKGNGVLVLHAWWGLNDTMKAFCTRLAQAGFVAFAPDLYHGKVADNIADAETLVKALDANIALDLAAADPEHIRSVVLFYGTGPGSATSAAQGQPTSVTLPRTMSLSRNPTSTPWRKC